MKVREDLEIAGNKGKALIKAYNKAESYIQTWKTTKRQQKIMNGYAKLLRKI